MHFTDYITGTVIQGLGNGHKFGFPTANVQPDTPVKLKKGAYAAWVRYDGKRHKGMLYVGTRPTLNLREITYEIHIIDANPRLSKSPTKSTLSTPALNYTAKKSRSNPFTKSPRKKNSRARKNSSRLFLIIKEPPK